MRAATAIGIALVLILTFVGGFSVGWTADIVVSGINSELIVQCITALGGLALALWTYSKTKKSEAMARHFPEKAKIYEGLLDQLKRLQIAGKPEFGGSAVDENEMAKTMLDIKFKAIIWGDQGLLDALAEIENVSADNDLVTIFDRWARLYEQMRRELGHKDRNGFGWDLIALNILREERDQFHMMKKVALSRRTPAS